MWGAVQCRATSKAIAPHVFCDIRPDGARLHADDKPRLNSSVKFELLPSVGPLAGRDLAELVV